MICSLASGDKSDESLFAAIAADLAIRGYSVQLGALPAVLGSDLARHLDGMPADEFKQARIGRHSQRMRDEQIRSDAICWITKGYQAGDDWLQWVAKMQLALNRQLFLGLFSFESHFAHYAAGGFYRRHLDAFRGQADRVLSVIVYLNPDWVEEDGGQLTLFSNNNEDAERIVVDPQFGTVVLFLSEDVPHEVLMTQCDRYSIAGWFRLRPV